MPDVTRLLGRQVYGNPVPRVRQIGVADLDARSAPGGRGAEGDESIPPSDSEVILTVNKCRRGGRVV